jgi:hypothetical protein
MLNHIFRSLSILVSAHHTVCSQFQTLFRVQAANVIGTLTCLALHGMQPLRDFLCGLRVFVVFMSPDGIVTHHFQSKLMDEARVASLWMGKCR